MTSIADWWSRFALGFAAWELRRRRAARKSRNICTDCGERPARPGRRCCLACQVEANASSKRTYVARRDAGLCPRCGGERDSEYLECEGCRERQRRQTREAPLRCGKAAWISAGRALFQ